MIGYFAGRDFLIDPFALSPKSEMADGREQPAIMQRATGQIFEKACVCALLIPARP